MAERKARSRVIVARRGNRTKGGERVEKGWRKGGEKVDVVAARRDENGYAIIELASGFAAHLREYKSRVRGSLDTRDNEFHHYPRTWQNARKRHCAAVRRENMDLHFRIN